ncbi:MAG: alanine--glyoxylate aminotransferase family protein [Chloroflexi bacterium]|nr:alanine--glyoxylate aminotransferase family protein [Chloroflexota bacterium]
MNLRIPGPTPLPPEVFAAMQRPMVDHRGAEFAAMTLRIVAGLRQMIGTKGDLFLITSSGTGGIESALVNTLSPGDKVLALAAGTFGDKFATMARAFGADVKTVRYANGEGVDPARVAAELQAMPDCRAVVLTHNETSTGVLHPLREIAAAVRQHSEAVFMADSVSGMGGVEIDMDAWGVDVLITGSQKALMAPPGVAVIAVGERAWRANAAAKTPRYYFDWRMHKENMDSGGFTPSTPTLPIFFALDAALTLMENEGMPAIYARHRRLMALTRRRAREIGFALLASERVASPTVTALRMPAGVDADELRRMAREEMDVVFGGGLGDMRGQVIRVGHMGYTNETDINQAMDALAEIAHRVLPHA